MFNNRNSKSTEERELKQEERTRAMTHGHIATWPHAVMHMTKASTQAREACADAYRCGRQKVYFGLPKLTSSLS